MGDLTLHTFAQDGSADQKQIGFFQQFQTEPKCHGTLGRKLIANQHRKVRMRCPSQMSHMFICIEHIQASTAHIIQLLFRIRITVRRADIHLLAMTVGLQELLLQLLLETFTAQL